MIPTSQDDLAEMAMEMMNLEELAEVQLVISFLAEIENRQARAMRAMAAAHNLDLDVEVPDRETRYQSLLSAAEAAGNGNAVEWWVRNRYGGALNDPAKATEYAGMDPADWKEQISDWAAHYRTQGYDDDRDDRDLAAIAVREAFGVGIDWFEEHIVGLDTQRAVSELLAGNLQSVERGLWEAAAQGRLDDADTSD
jgi:hypothetical protein